MRKKFPRIILFGVAALLLIAAVRAQTDHLTPELVSFATQDGGIVYGDLYGRGRRGVVLVHGGRFTKESWAKQASQLVASGFRVLAIDLRGKGRSTGPGKDDVYTAPLHLDVLAAVRYLHKNGAKAVSVVGGSLGGGAAADAVTEAKPGEVSRLVTLGYLSSNLPPEKINVPLMVILTRNDANAAGPRLSSIKTQFDKVPATKELVILEGSAHAQQMFETNQSEKIMKLIIKFLSKDK